MTTTISKKLLPFLMVPVLAIGCADASGADDDTQNDEGAFTASAAAGFKASVGAVAVDGKRVCTAALVDVDASAKIGNVSASGRQVLLGGACLGKLKEGFIGGAVFVAQKNKVSIATPILSIDFSSVAEAGFAVGILSDKPEDMKPMRLRGFNATVHGGGEIATIVHAGEDGALIASSVKVGAGVEFNLVTKCTEWHFKAEAEVGAGAALSADELGLGAAAFVSVNGELEFAASIDGKCIARQVKKALKLPLNAANAIGDEFAKAGAGKIIASYDLPTKGGKHEFEVTLKMYEDASELRVNGRGRVSAEVLGAKCDEHFGACKLRPQGGLKRGSTITVKIDTHNNVFPDGDSGTRVFLSVPNAKGEDPAPAPSQDAP